MKARVHVFYKPSVYDPQGNTLEQSLKRMGFPSVQNVRVGKVIDVEIDKKSEEEIKQDLKQMCDKLLANPVIESYSYELLPPI